MFGKLWTWIEDSVYAALTRGVQRWVNDVSNPDDVAGNPQPQLTLRFPALVEQKDKKGRKAE